MHVKDCRCILVEQSLHKFRTHSFVLPGPNTSRCCIITTIVAASVSSVFGVSIICVLSNSKDDDMATDASQYYQRPGRDCKTTRRSMRAVNTDDDPNTTRVLLLLSSNPSTLRILAVICCIHQPRLVEHCRSCKRTHRLIHSPPTSFRFCQYGKSVRSRNGI